MTPEPARSRNTLLFLVFADLMGFGMLIPDVQLRAERLGAKGWLIGAILSSMFVVQALASPLWGSLSDRIGRKPVLIACTSLSALSMLAYSQATSVWIILATRILAGLGAANVSTAQAAIADASSPVQRTVEMGRVGAVVSAGLIAGPALGGVLAARGGALLLGLVAGSISIAGILSVAFFVPAARPVPDKTSDNKGKFRVFEGRRVLLVLFVAATVGWLALACLEGTFGRLIERTVGQGVFAYGLIFGYESLLSVLVQSYLVGVIQPRLGDRRLLLIAFALQGIGLAAMPFASSIPPLLLAATIYALGNGLLGPSINGWCSRVTPERQQGAMFGLLQSARSLGFMIGPTLGGALFDFRPMAPYLVAGGVSAIAATFVALATRRADELGTEVN